MNDPERKWVAAMAVLRGALERELVYMDALTPDELQKALDRFNAAVAPTHQRERQGQEAAPRQAARTLEPKTYVCVVRSLPGYGVMEFLPKVHHPGCPAYRSR